MASKAEMVGVGLAAILALGAIGLVANNAGEQPAQQQDGTHIGGVACSGVILTYDSKTHHYHARPKTSGHIPTGTHTQGHAKYSNWSTIGYDETGVSTVTIQPTNHGHELVDVTADIILPHDQGTVHCPPVFK